MEINFNNRINEKPKNVYKDWAQFLTSLTPNEFTVLATLIGITIFQNLSLPEQNSIGNFFLLIGQIGVTYNGQAYTIERLNDEA